MKSAAAGEKMISIRNVVKRFGDKVAVDGLSLEVAPGEFFAILGPNGAGKTTTIKMVAGLLKPSEGVIEVCGHDISADTVEAKKVTAYVPDQPFLYDNLSGIEFLNFIGDLYDVTGAEPLELMTALFVKICPQISRLPLTFVKDPT